MTESAMELSERRHWIFDLDGTLTVAIHDFDAIRRELGLTPGIPILEQLSEMPEPRAKSVLARLEVIELELARRAEPLAGADPLLSSLRRRGRRLGIVTRNSHANALETLRHCGLEPHFDPRFVLGREACLPKPSPDGIHKLLELWQAPASDAVMVGNYRFDLESGREAGTATVYVDPSGAHPFSSHADWCVRDLAELHRRLDAETASS